MLARDSPTCKLFFLLGVVFVPQWVQNGYMKFSGAHTTSKKGAHTMMTTNTYLPFLCTIEANWGDGEGWQPEVAAISDPTEIANALSELHALGSVRTRVVYYGGVLDADYLAGYGIVCNATAVEIG